MSFLRPNTLQKIFQRSYTCVVERFVQPKLVKKGIDPRKLRLKAEHFHYKFVDCSHTKKWGNMEVILTQYLEGVGHKGELLEVSRHLAHYELLPTGLAVFPTIENLELYRNEIEEAKKKPKLSQYAVATRDQLSKITLEIQMNTDEKWTLNKDHVRIALRYSDFMCESNDFIELPENSEEIKSDGDKKYYTNIFTCNVKINTYMSVPVKCKIVPIDITRLWEQFSMVNKRI